jgi:NDP-sugar pyrophosphorylase family protein
MLSAPDAIILCGGLGLRLRSLTGTSKSMASVSGRPFLELLFHQLKRHSIERVILAVGYRSEEIRSHFGDRVFGLQLAYSTELSPLGTGGALRQAADLVKTDLILTMNGDSYTDADICNLVNRHRTSQADVSVLVVPVDGRDDCGSVTVEEGDRVAAFHEKKKAPGSKDINAGMYVMSRQIAADISSGKQVSLEQEVFPRWLSEGKYVRAHWEGAQCIDIGTPERYSRAQAILAKAESAGDCREYR